MTDLPAPLVPPDADVEGLPGFMLDTTRLLNSELVALSTGDEFKAAVNLWARAWKQRPAGSLPDDDKVLAIFSGAGKKWPKVKAMALRGFIKCSDGRLYHKVLCEDVLRAARLKTGYLVNRQTDRERLRAWREAKRKKQCETAAKPVSETAAKRHRNESETSNTGQDSTRIETTPQGESLEAVGARVCRVAGVDEGRVAVDFVEIDRWLKAGYDVEQDILPTVRGIAMAADYEPPANLRYFTRAIARANRRRLEPLPHVNGPTRKSTNIMAGSREDIEQQLDMGLMTPDEAKAEIAKLGERVRD